MRRTIRDSDRGTDQEGELTLTFRALHRWQPVRAFLWFNRGILTDIYAFVAWDMKSTIPKSECEGPCEVQLGRHRSLWPIFPKWAAAVMELSRTRTLFTLELKAKAKIPGNHGEERAMRCIIFIYWTSMLGVNCIKSHQSHNLIDEFPAVSS
jgi:hypothetical protein